MCLGPKVRKDVWKCAFTGKASPLATNETSQSGGICHVTRLLLPLAMEPDTAPVVRTSRRHN